MATSTEWAIGFARQASADFATYLQLIGSPEVPQCHRLHFLQMACEKLVKAYLIDGGTAPASVQSSHAYIATTLPIIIREQMSLSKVKPHNQAWLLKHARLLSAEIEILAPSVRRGGAREDNCEYPWEDGAGHLRVPIDWQFKPASELLLASAGRSSLKLVHDAILRLHAGA